MKNIIITIITIFVSIFTASCGEKSDAEKFIADYNNCASVQITEFGDIQKFPYATRKVLAWSLRTSKEAAYVAECTANAFHAKSVNDAIKMLKECKDSTDKFKMSMPSSSTMDNLTLVAKNPVLYLDKNLNDDFFKMVDARKVTYILPNGNIETDVLIYNEDGEMQGLGITFGDSVIGFFKSCSNFYNQCRELYTDLDDWKNGEYDVIH
jgi:hypothetical protein